jgi:hypothetical protein
MESSESVDEISPRGKKLADAAPRSTERPWRGPSSISANTSRTEIYTSLLTFLFSSAYFQIYNYNRLQLQNNTMIKDMIDKQVLELKKLWANKRQLLFQLLNLAMIVFSALMIWKGLMFLTKVRFDETV